MRATRLSAIRIRAILAPLFGPDDLETGFGPFAQRVLKQACRLTSADRATLRLHRGTPRGSRTRAPRVGSVLRFPLLLQGQVVGELAVHPAAGAFSEQEHDILEVLHLAIEAALSLSLPSVLRPLRWSKHR